MKCTNNIQWFLFLCFLLFIIILMVVLVFIPKDFIIHCLGKYTRIWLFILNFKLAGVFSCFITVTYLGGFTCAWFHCEGRAMLACHCLYLFIIDAVVFHWNRYMLCLQRNMKRWLRHTPWWAKSCKTPWMKIPTMRNPFRSWRFQNIKYSFIIYVVFFFLWICLGVSRAGWSEKAWTWL